MSDPKLCKPLLEYILNIKIKSIEYPELQKVIDKRYDSKGIRLDVYVEDDKNTDMTLNDDTAKIVVNPTGTRGEINDELKAALDYIAGRAPTMPYSKDLDKAVGKVKNDEKWRERFMKLSLRDREHERLGKYSEKVSTIKKFRNVLDESNLLKVVDDDEKIFSRIIYLIDNNPEYDDDEIAEKLLDEEE